MAYKEKWVVRAKKADFKALGEKYGIDQVTARILINRGVSEDKIEEFLNPSLSSLYEPKLLKDSEKAVSVLKEYILNKKKIRIVGDYDIDGICSTYILHDAFLFLGGNSDFRIPHRVLDGYGINRSMVDDAKKDGVDLIITCDNGIAAFDAMEAASEYDIPVIITDHHELQFEENENGEKKDLIPKSIAAINPHRSDCPYPFKEICGAEVAFKLVQILFSVFSYTYDDAIKRYLPFAAFATIGDIMPLKDENRSIVKHGLKALENTDNPGMKALLSRCGLYNKPLSPYHMGFIIGPCFNASGRLDTATLAINLLEEKESEEAILLADQLFVLNEERKEMTKEGDKKAFSMIEENNMDTDPVIVLYVPGIHESLAGLVAGHIKEKYYRPVIVFSDSDDGNIKGSGRSIEGYHMFLKLKEVESLIEKYGGHKMAAGLTIKKENLHSFREELIKRADLSDKELTKKIMIDVPMPLSYVSEKVINEIEKMAPFGNGNEKPLFADKELKLFSLFEMGKDKEYLKATFLLNDGRKIEGLMFRNAEIFKEQLFKKYGEEAYKELLLRNNKNDIKLTFTYEPKINEFRGERSIQVMIEDLLVV